MAPSTLSDPPGAARPSQGSILAAGTRAAWRTDDGPQPPSATNTRPQHARSRTHHSTTRPPPALRARTARLPEAVEGAPKSGPREAPVAAHEGEERPGANGVENGAVIGTLAVDSSRPRRNGTTRPPGDLNSGCTHGPSRRIRLLSIVRLPRLPTTSAALLAHHRRTVRQMKSVRKQRRPGSIRDRDEPEIESDARLVVGQVFWSATRQSVGVGV